MSEDTELLRRVASYGLPEHTAPLLDAPLEPGPWSSLLGQVGRQRLLGYLHAAKEAGDLALTDEQATELDQRHQEACARAVRLDRQLVRIVDHLDARGIEVVVLKGTASAHLLYPDPAMRVFADNDLLLRGRDFERGLAAITELGYVRPVAPPRPDFDRRFSKGATLKGAQGDEVDLHRNLVFGTFGFAIELDRLFTDNVTFALGGRTFQALSPTNRLLHACYHTALGDPDPRLSSLRDLAQIVAVGDHDDAEVLRVVQRWRAEAVVARAFGLCREVLGVTVSGHLAHAVASYQPSRRERRAIDSYVGANRHYAAKVMASLAYLDGVGTKLAFLRAAAVPSEEFVESRGTEPRGAWIRRGVRSLFSGGLR